MKPRWYRIQSRRNSRCNLPFDALDWGNWWVDESFGQRYIHIESLDGETVQRVYCRHSDTPRIAVKDGELHWLVDGETS